MRVYFLCFALIFTATIVNAQKFTAGNLVVYRAHDGLSKPKSKIEGVKIFLDEYTPTGKLVSSLEMPSKKEGNNNRCITQFNGNTEGQINLSANKKYLIIPGYDADLQTTNLGSTVATATKRIIGIVGNDRLVNTSTGIISHSKAAFRSIASQDGNIFYTAAGNEGCLMASAGSNKTINISNTKTNNRTIKIFGGQLYLATASGAEPRIGAVGAGTPIVGGNNYLGFKGVSGSASMYSFILFDLDSKTPGMDVLYCTDDVANTITKYSLVKDVWVNNGTIALKGARGLVGSQDGKHINLYATNQLGVFSKIDKAGYNNPFTTGEPNQIVFAKENTIIRGIAFAPEEVKGETVFLEQVAVAKTGEGANVTFSFLKNSKPRKVEVQKSLDGSLYTTIGTVSASSKEAFYEYLDDKMDEGLSYYRLLIHANNGEIKTSPTISLYNNTDGFNVGRPFEDNDGARIFVPVSCSKIEETQMIITTADNKPVYQGRVKVTLGSTSVPVNITAYPPGTYFITVIQLNKKGTVKYIKK